MDLPSPSPSTHTATDIQKVKAVQRRAASGCIETITTLPALKDLNWRPLDQRRTDSRLVMLNKVTLQSPHSSASPVILGHQNIYIHFQTDRLPLSKTITGSYLFPRTIIYWNALPAHIPVLPTLAQFSSVVCLSLNTSFCVYLLTILTLFTLYKLISPPFLWFLFS